MTTPFAILQAWAEARATLFSWGDYKDIEEAVAPLREYAIRTGIVESLGPKATMTIIEAPFRKAVENAPRV
jgi:hypothetical protein